MRALLSRLSGKLKRPPAVEAPAVTPEESSPELAGFADTQRRISIYLRAMWDINFVLREANYESGEHREGFPYIDEGLIHLPSTYESTPELSATQRYRAAAAHASAHLVHTVEAFSPRSLDRLQIALIGLIEDARVEALAIRQFPGLLPLWRKFHSTDAQQNQTAGDYLNRLSRALLDPDYQDDDAWVAQGRTLFSAIDLEDQQQSRNLGLTLADSFREKKLRYQPDEDRQRAAYRDDNFWLWIRAPRLEVINPYWKTRRFLRSRKAAPPPASTFVYSEWNYRSQTSDQAWVTLREAEAPTGEVAIIDDIIAENNHLLARMKALLHALREGATSRIRKLEHGDELDINAVIRSRIDLRQGSQPDPRVMMRTAPRHRDIAVLMLLDLSRSMNDKIEGRDLTALQLTRQVCALFADAISSVGDPFAIHGFTSLSRHNVEYHRLKDFDQAYDDKPKARLAGIAGQEGTRMGAAVRHATHLLNQQKSAKKLLMVISDGAPSDIDVPDHRYLRDDTKKAVEDAKRNGINTYCISLDAAADEYVAKIFGPRNYMVVDHIRNLPEKTLLLYASLTR
jgi:hypothetical protein